MSDASQVLVGANGSLHFAPLGTTMPTDLTTALDAAFVDVGFITSDGARWRDGKSVNPVNPWQSFYKIRSIVDSRENQVQAELLQWNKDTIALAFGGGTVTEPSAGVFQYDPPSPQTVDQRMMVLEWQDGTRNYRLLYFACELVDDVEVTLARSAPGTLPITVEAIDDGTNPIYRLLTDDGAVDPTP